MYQCSECRSQPRPCALHAVYESKSHWAITSHLIISIHTKRRAPIISNLPQSFVQTEFSNHRGCSPVESLCEWKAVLERV